MRNRQRSFWGWGYADEELSARFLERFKGLIQMALALPELDNIEPPKLEDLQLRAPRFQLSPSLETFCTDEIFDRASHSYGKSYRDVVRGLYGHFENPPDFVAYPRTEDEIRRLMDFCSSENVALVPFGGGSSVVGGVEPTESTHFNGVISCDMRHFDQILDVDPFERTAQIQGGIFGPALEAGLKAHGLTLRHFPQSFEFSTLGGWIATRSGGHFATVYTHIDEFVQSIRMVTPEGIWQTRPLPGSGAGPDPNRFLMGSEGIFGIITEATVRLQNVPSFRASTTVAFADADAGIEAVRRLSQSGLFPTNCRLISPIEAFTMGLGNGNDTVLLLGFESHDHDQTAKLDRALEICTEQGGRSNDDDKSSDSSETATSQSAADRWKKNFLRAPYLRDQLVRSGLIVETFETAVPWGRFENFHKNVLEETQRAVETHCERGIVTWRFTHVYPDGPAPYYTVMAPGRRGEELAQWDAIKKAASDAILRNGGTITHHHAVGKDHCAGYEEQRDPLFGQVLKQAKESLDPQGILNPDVLISREND